LISDDQTQKKLADQEEPKNPKTSNKDDKAVSGDFD